MKDIFGSMFNNNGPLNFNRNFVSNPKMFKMTDGSYKSVLASEDNYDPSKDTKIVIHGWKNTYKSSVGQSIKNAYLSREDYNVFGKCV